MLCRNCYREIPDGSKFCPECGAPTEAGAIAAMGNNLQDQMAQSGFDPGNYERHTLGDVVDVENDVAPANEVIVQPQPQQQYQQQGSNPQGQYQQGQYRQGQNLPPWPAAAQQGMYDNLPPQKQGQSGLSIAAMIFGILTCTALIGFILGVIDLAKNSGDGKKHGGSIFAVTWGGILIACVLLRAYSDDLPFAKKSASTPSQQTESEYTTDSYDSAPATDDRGVTGSDSYSEPAAENSYEQQDNSYEQESNDPGTVDPQLKAMLDSYEEFMDEYIQFLKTYSTSNDPMALLSEYTTYMTKYSQLMQKISELDQMQNQMTQADLAYYIDWNARIQKKILEISDFN